MSIYPYQLPSHRSGTNTKSLADRTTAIGKMIDSYLKSHSDLDDRAIHLLFSANRWELAYVRPASLATQAAIP